MASKHGAYRALKASRLFPPTPKKAGPGVEKSRFRPPKEIRFRNNPHKGPHSELIFVQRINGKRIGTMRITSSDITLLGEFSLELIKFIKRKHGKRKMPKEELIKEAGLFLDFQGLNPEKRKLVLDTVSKIASES